jgi:UDP-N-acetylmuramoyl-tripeptide--D-alanyl-D-alanine ligase
MMLGAMAEVGAESLAEHQQIVDLIARYEWADVALVGGDFKTLKSPYHYFPDSASAGDWLRKKDITGYSLLIKGSRSMKMEQVLSD